MITNFSFSSFFKTILRFPFETLAGVIFSVLGIIAVEAESSEVFPFSLVLSAVLLYALQLCGSAIAEQYGKKFHWLHWLWIIASFLLAAVSAMSLWNGQQGSFLFVQYAIWTLSLLFCSVVFGFSKKEELINRLWRVSEQVIFSILAAFFSGAVFFIGMILLYAALENLFGVFIPSNLYSQTWFAIVGSISSLTFLSFFPKQNIDNSSLTPSSFGKIFSLYILLPLSVGYVLLMYGYTGKIIWEQALPNGFLAGFIAGFSALVLFMLYMLDSLRATHSWIAWISKAFSVLLLPQAVLMAWSVWIRIDTYGVTENRYFGLMLAVWIFVVAALWGFRKIFTIRIPVVLIALLFTLGSFGPWGAENISLTSQTNRFLEVLAKYNLVENGKVVFPNEKPKYSEDDISFLHNQIGYLFYDHSLKTLKDISALSLDENFGKDLQNPYEWDYSLEYKVKLGLLNKSEINVNKWGENTESVWLYRNEETIKTWDTASYKHIAHIKKSSNTSCREILQFRDDKIFLTLKQDLQIDISEYMNSISNNSIIASEIDGTPQAQPLISPEYIQIENEQGKILLYLLNFDGEKYNGKLQTCNALEAIVLYSEK